MTRTAYVVAAASDVRVTVRDMSLCPGDMASASVVASRALRLPLGCATVVATVKVSSVSGRTV